MTELQQILKRIIILQCQIAESIENGEIEMGYVRTTTDEIEEMIDKLSIPKTNKDE